MHVDFEDKAEYLLASVSGGYDSEAAVASFEMALAQCDSLNRDRILVDLRSSEVPSFATEKAIYAMRIVELYQAHSEATGNRVRIAYLAEPSYAGAFDPGLELVVSLGLPLNLFTDATEAMLWLANSDSAAGS